MALVPRIEGMNDNDIAIAFTVGIPAVLIGLNRLTWDPEATGRGWRASGKLTRFGVKAAVVGFVAFTTLYFVDKWLPGLGNLGDPLEKLMTLFVLFWLGLYGAGVLATLASLILRLWLRLDMGPAEAARFFLFGFFRFVGFVVLGWFMGFRNLVFLRLLKGRPLFEDEPRAPSPYRGMSYKAVRRTYGAPPG